MVDIPGWPLHCWEFWELKVKNAIQLVSSLHDWTGLLLVFMVTTAGDIQELLGSSAPWLSSFFSSLKISQVIGVLGVTFFLPDIFRGPANVKTKKVSLVQFPRRVLAVFCVFGAFYQHTQKSFLPKYDKEYRQSHYGKLSISDALKYRQSIASRGETSRNSVIYPLTTKDRWFIEGRTVGENKNRRTVMIRAVNLSGESKLPTGCTSHVHCLRMYPDPRNVTFVGRPFPLETETERQGARVHLARIRSWGFNAIRYIVTWEAIEHTGPGEYDQDYLLHVQSTVRLCAEFGLAVIIDFHQDVWSRFTGGDGAPAWTLEAVGFDIDTLIESGAAVLSDHHPKIDMLWATNYNRLAPSTMFTVFFAGNTYAPSCFIKGETCQDYLQTYYIGAVKALASALKDEPNVIGFDTMNEPSTGYVGMESLLNHVYKLPWGWHIDGFTSMYAPSGDADLAFVPKFSSFLRFEGMANVNPNRVSAWKSTNYDLWRNEGIWDIDATTGKAKLLRPHHFQFNTKGHAVNFVQDFMSPFFTSVNNMLNEINADWITFAEPAIDPSSPLPEAPPNELAQQNLGLEREGKFAWAPHYYDFTSFVSLCYPWFALDYETEGVALGRNGANAAVDQNVARLGDGHLPTLVGETGISMKMNHKAAYRHDGVDDFTSHVHCLERTLRAMERNHISYSLWNYAPSNTNNAGDHWNGEDFSLFSRDQRQPSAADYVGDIIREQGIDEGGRVIEAAVRPYPIKTCGTPISLQFDALDPARTFDYSFQSWQDTESDGHNNGNDAPVTVMFIPTFQYPNGIVCTISDGSFNYHREEQLLLWHQDSSTTTHRITVAQSVQAET